MPSSHARLSASAAARWINCPGSIKLAEDLDLKSTSSPYADEGTLAHAVAEYKVSKSTSGPAYKKELRKWEKSEYWCGEMDEATDFYRDEVYSIYMDLLQKDPKTIQMVEQKVDLGEWIPEGFGTSDAVVIGNHEIHIIDLKYGKGVKVDAHNNPQLRLYGLGTVALFKDLYEFSEVHLHIIQPRLDHISHEFMPVSELEHWGEAIVKPAAKEAYEGSERQKCGEWCKFCPAKAVCRKRAEENLELARMDFKKPAYLTEEEIGEVLAQMDALTSWVKDVSEYALQKALEGEHFEGWKLVEGRSNRKYADEDKVVEKLTKEGYDEAMLYSKKLLTITEMEKLIGKKKFSELLEGKEGLVIKPEGKPVLVPVSDKRDAINTAKKAAEDFS